MALNLELLDALQSPGMPTEAVLIDEDTITEQLSLDLEIEPNTASDSYTAVPLQVTEEPVQPDDIPGCYQSPAEALQICLHIADLYKEYERHSDLLKQVESDPTLEVMIKGENMMLSRLRKEILHYLAELTNN